MVVKITSVTTITSVEGPRYHTPLLAIGKPYVLVKTCSLTNL